MNHLLIIKQELLENNISAQIEPGCYLYYKGGQYMELWHIDSIQENTVMMHRVNANTGETGPVEKNTLSNVKAYYTPAGKDIQYMHELSMKILQGEQLEKTEETGDENALMHMGNKRTLVSMRSKLEEKNRALEMIRRHTQYVIDETRRTMMQKVEEINSMMTKMKKEMEKLDYVIQTIETYAGIKEDIVTVQAGVPASEDTPVVVRQAVIYLDEEMALIDCDFDWRKMDNFDKWLVTDGNYRKLMPDLKSIIAVKPRRKDKVYAYGQSSQDAWVNWIMNQNNHVTLFLIRNGENIYRIESEHVVLDDRMFPNENEYHDILLKEQQEVKKWGGAADADKSVRFRKRYTKVSFLLQGLLERSEVFSPHRFTGNIIRMEGLDGQVEMLYELDAGRSLTDGRPPFRQWMQELNGKLCEGKRVLLIKGGYGLEGYAFTRKDFITYYSSDWNRPAYPEDGIYTLYGNKYKDKYNRQAPFVVKYLPDDKVYTWSSVKDRVNRVSIQVSPDGKGILNYDDIDMRDVDYYLNSRLHRSQYHEFVRLLQSVKRLMEDEQMAELDFVHMMKGQMIQRGCIPKDGRSHEEVIQLALAEIKRRLKWKRPVSTKERETYFMVERKLFSNEFRKKFF